MKWKQSLNKWRTTRKITKPLEDFEGAIESEVDEYTTAVRANDIHEQIDACGDIITFATNQIHLLGYDVDAVMKEICKEISSRNQDPAQAARDWSEEKWEKDRSQDSTTLYKSDFSRCKLS